MRIPFTIHRILIAITLAAASQLYGCVAASDSSSGAGGENIRRLPASNDRLTAGAAPVSTIVDARPAALVNGQSVTWGELRPYLTDLAGAQALEEVVLDRRINEELTKAGIVIGLDDAVAERRTILQSFADDPNDAIRLLNEWRNAQSLGDARFEALLLRKAGLRALVRSRTNAAEAAAPETSQTAPGDREQSMMDQLATELLGRTTVSVFDDELKSSWQRRKKR
jgi:hypothetical protein